MSAIRCRFGQFDADLVSHCANQEESGIYGDSDPLLALGFALSVRFSFLWMRLCSSLCRTAIHQHCWECMSTSRFARAAIFRISIMWIGRELNKVFASLEIYHNNGYILTTPTGVEPARAGSVSAGFFRTLGVAPALGRDFYAGEDRPGAPHTVMLSHASWQKRYAGNPGVLGQTMVLERFLRDHWRVAGKVSFRAYGPSGVLDLRRWRRPVREAAKLPQPSWYRAAQGWRDRRDGAWRR